MESLLAPRLDRVQLEQRRIEAIDFFNRGWSQAYVARKLHVSRTSASRWQRAWKAGASLERRIAPGRPIQLPREALAALYQAGMTASELRDLVQDRHGVRYSRDHVGRMMFLLKLRPRMRIHVKRAVAEVIGG